MGFEILPLSTVSQFSASLRSRLQVLSRLREDSCSPPKTRSPRAGISFSNPRRTLPSGWLSPWPTFSSRLPGHPGSETFVLADVRQSYVVAFNSACMNRVGITEKTLAEFAITCLKKGRDAHARQGHVWTPIVPISSQNSSRPSSNSQYLFRKRPKAARNPFVARNSVSAAASDHVQDGRLPKKIQRWPPSPRFICDLALATNPCLLEVGRG